MNAAVGKKSHKVESSAVFKRLVHCRNNSLVVLELVLIYSLCDSCKLLINDSACTDVGVTNLGVTHLTVGKTNVHTRSANLSKGIFGKKLINVRFICGFDSVAAFGCNTETVKNHKNQRFFHKAKSFRVLKNYLLAALTIAANFSATSDAPPIRPPSTLVFERSSSALPSFIEPPY